MAKASLLYTHKETIRREEEHIKYSEMPTVWTPSLP
jgi:hypothetical protein